MDGVDLRPARSLGPQPCYVSGSLACNGTSNPDVTLSRYPRGFKITAARTGVGLWTITAPAGDGTPAQPHSIQVTPQADVAADWFEVCLLAETTLNTTTRSFTLLLHRNGTPLDPAAAAGTRVNFAIFFDNSTGA